MIADPTSSLRRSFEARFEHYAFPPAAAEVLRLYQDPEVDVEDITKSVERDVALSLRLLELSNSALFARADQVCSVGEAICFLGKRTVQTVALALLLKSLREGDANRAASVSSFWQHAVLTAAAARGLASLGRAGHPDEAYLAGLVMDLAFPILMDLNPSDYNSLAIGNGGAHPDELAEFELLGISHAELAAWMLRRWGLPDHLVEAVSGHHFPNEIVMSTRARPLARTLWAAHEFALRLRSPRNHGVAGPEFLAVAFGDDFYDARGLKSFLAGLETQVRLSSELLDVEVDEAAFASLRTVD